MIHIDWDRAVCAKTLVECYSTNMEEESDPMKYYCENRRLVHNKTNKVKFALKMVDMAV